MEHDGCVGCKYEMCELDSIECSGCKQNATDKYTKKTNREVMLDKLKEDIEYLAKNLIVVSQFDDGYDDNCDEWISIYVDEYTSPNGRKYHDYDYDECLKDTIKWLNEESE